MTPSRKPQTGDESDIFDDVTMVALFMAQLCKLLIEPGEERDDLFCPVCGKTLRYMRAKSNGHVFVTCPTKDCVRAME